MALDATKVYIGLADQSAAAGAIYSGTLIDPDDIPTTFSEAETLAGAMTSSGYVSEDGLTLSTDYSTSDIREWNGALVRRILESFDGTLSWTLIQLDAEGWKQAFGEENVSVTPATALAGEQISISLGSHLPNPKSWCFKMKDGDAKIIIFVPNGQITAVDDITFNATEAIALPVTLSTYDDGDGESILIFMDDGAPLVSS